MEIKNVVLASASPRRKELLLQIGIQPEIVVSHVVERVTSSVPSEVVMELASQKAADVAAGRKAGETAVSYTHLDVYKRQPLQQLHLPLRQHGHGGKAGVAGPGIPGKI